MRVTFVLPYAGLAGGIRVVAIYAERLRARGHDVFVVSTPRKTLSTRTKVKHLLAEWRWPRSPSPEPSYFDELPVTHHVTDRYRPILDSDVPNSDVVVATWWETAEWVSRLSPEKGAKAYLIQHYETWGGDAARVNATWRLPMQKIVISKWLLDLARNMDPAGPVAHVPNSVDTRQFYANSRVKQAEPTVGFLYSRASFKGTDAALAVIAESQKRLATMRTVAFGTECPIAELPLPTRAEYFERPSQDSIRDIYSRCDAWLCASRAEGFHLPPLEAMACRCPVVSTRVGGPLDILKDGWNGYLAEVDDIQALSDRLVHVLKMPNEQWQSMARSAHATAVGYTWDDATLLFEQALENALGLERSTHRSTRTTETTIAAGKIL